jgi:hypothetical protein
MTELIHRKLLEIDNEYMIFNEKELYRILAEYMGYNYIWNEKTETLELPFYDERIPIKIEYDYTFYAERNNIKFRMERFLRKNYYFCKNVESSYERMRDLPNKKRGKPYSIQFKAYRDSNSLDMNGYGQMRRDIASIFLCATGKEFVWMGDFKIA